MDGLISSYSSLIGDFELTRTSLVAIIGVVTTTIAAALFFIVGMINDPRNQRLGAIIHEEDDGSTFARFSASIESFATPKQAKERQTVAKRLIMAGYRSTNALSIYYALKLLLTLGLAAAALLALVTLPHSLSILQIVIVVLSAAAVGILIPGIVLERRIVYRAKQIMRGIPDALDLLVTCAEAGLGLNQGLQRVAEEIRVGHRELAQELDVVNAEIGAGVDRSQALAGLYKRTGLDEIRGLVSMFNQTMRFGTSIADALRTYAEEFRDRRTQAAEEKAAKLGTKMIFPLVFCFFPAFFVVAIGPAAIKIIRAFSGM